MNGRHELEHARRHERELARRRRHTLELALMLLLEVLCALSVVACLLAAARGQETWAAVFAIAAALSFIGAQETDPT